MTAHTHTHYVATLATQYKRMKPTEAKRDLLLRHVRKLCQVQVFGEELPELQKWGLQQLYAADDFYLATSHNDLIRSLKATKATLPQYNLSDNVTLRPKDQRSQLEMYHKGTRVDHRCWMYCEVKLSPTA